MADLIILFCKGEGFGGNCCEHYKIFTKECRLLIGRKLKEIFKEGRCEPPIMVKDAVKRNLYNYRDKIAPDEYIKPMVFEISERIKQRCLNCPKLPVLKGYINRAAYTEVIRMLTDEGILPKGECGNCVYLSNSEPYICQREYIIVEGETIENPHYGEKKNPSSRLCKEGFEPLQPPGPVGPTDPEAPTVILLETMKKSLAKRMESAENKNRKKKI